MRSISLLIIMMILGLSTFSYAQSGTSDAELPVFSSDRELLFHANLNAQSFARPASQISGLSYGLNLSLYDPGTFVLYGDLPMLFGEKQQKSVQEMGNPVLGLNYRLFNSGSVEGWGEASASFLQRDAKLANRHDTYRLGMSLRSNRNRFYNSMGAGYRLRSNEQDPKVNIGDVVDGHLLFGYKLASHWSLQTQLDYLYSTGIKKEQLVFARDASWAGVSPGVKYRLASSIELTSSLTFPIYLSRSSEEVEVSLWDLGGSGISEVSWKTQVGVAF